MKYALTIPIPLKCLEKSTDRDSRIIEGPVSAEDDLVLPSGIDEVDKGFFPVSGGMGIAAGGNLNPEGVSMFEPIGGSAPKYTGKNVINPLAAIGALQMLLEHIGEEKAASMIEKSVMRVTSEKLKSLSAGKMGYTTTEIGDLVAEFL